MISEKNEPNRSQWNLPRLLTPAAAFLCIALLFFPVSQTVRAAPPNEASTDRPNFLFILVDDLSEEALGVYKPDTYETPRMDELARSGLTFRHAYSMSKCYPTRTTMMSGVYTNRFPDASWGDFPGSFPKEKTLARILQRAGYRTAVAGKWQLTLLQSNPDHPHEMGFDEYFLNGWHEGPRYWNPLIWENGNKNVHTGKYGPDLYVDYLIDFIKKQAENEQPFFAFYSMCLVHNVGDDWNLDSWQPSVAPPHGPKGRYESFREMLAEVDSKVGQLIWVLEQLGIRENTVVVLTADNGTTRKQTLAYRDGQFVKKPIEHAGRKGTLKEGGIHVPLIVSWKGKTPTGTTDALVDFSDFLPTLTDLAGAELPDHNYDGTSFAPVLRGKADSTRDWIYAEDGSNFVVRNQRWKLYKNGKLFDMKNDPEEKNPVDPADLSSDERRTYQMLRDALKKIKARNSQK